MTFIEVDSGSRFEVDNDLHIEISFSTMVCPALLMAYGGQAAYLRKHPGDVLNTFYASIPHRVYWPMFVVAVAAAIIASQAMISATYAIIFQSLALGCFPRVKVVHTSYEGQIYIPEVNYFLMVACLLVTLAFKTTAKIVILVHMESCSVRHLLRSHRVPILGPGKVYSHSSS